ncbi:MAG: nicotinate phosphoribosyltransferase [Lachnospiraceae bacterium]|nr:nicotinate phosphoribosyltransferase [Lachnospiraceae bacterium]
MTKRNLALLTDFYELLMMEGYFSLSKAEKKNEPLVTFDVFYRNNPFGNGFAVFCGLNEIIDYLVSLKFNDDDIEYLRQYNLFDEEFLLYLKDFKWKGSVYSFEEGSIINKKEPIIKIVAPISQAQLIESAMLCAFNHETLIATKAYRICEAARPYGVMEFGLRRAMSFDAAIYGAKAACIAGCIGTSNVLTAKMYDIPALGTMAHSWIMSFENELTAFKEFATKYPDMAILLVDTYDTLKSGIPNAIKTFDYMKEKGIKSKKYGIRLDSGDLAYLSKVARKMLDDAGYKDAVICASNDLDENLIMSLNMQGAKISLYGVGTKLITGNGATLGGVYKLSSVYDEEKKVFNPKLKISSNVEKVTNPGNKEVYRVYDENDKLFADLITFNDESIDENKELTLFDPVNTWKKRVMEPGKYKIKKMLKPIFIDGKLVYEKKTVTESKKYFENELGTLYDDNKRLTNPKEIYVDLSQKLYDKKIELLSKYSK